MATLALKDYQVLDSDVWKSQIVVYACQPPLSNKQADSLRGQAVKLRCGIEVNLSGKELTVTIVREDTKTVKADLLVIENKLKELVR